MQIVMNYHPEMTMRSTYYQLKNQPLSEAANNALTPNVQNGMIIELSADQANVIPKQVHSDLLTSLAFDLKRLIIGLLDSQSIRRIAQTNKTNEKFVESLNKFNFSLFGGRFNSREQKSTALANVITTENELAENKALAEKLKQKNTELGSSNWHDCCDLGGEAYKREYYARYNRSLPAEKDCCISPGAIAIGTTAGIGASLTCAITCCIQTNIVFAVGSYITLGATFAVACIGLGSVCVTDVQNACVKNKIANNQYRLFKTEEKIKEIDERLRVLKSKRAIL